MKQICELTDKMILGLDGMSTKPPRITARAIVKNKDDLYAVMYAEKFGLYSLPGGGVEEGEDILTALRREIMEETGCTCDEVEALGIVAENRAHQNYTAKAYYYTVTTHHSTGKPRLTEAELAENTSLQWHTLGDAIRLIAAPEHTTNQRKFLQARDLAALREYLSRKESTVHLQYGKIVIRSATAADAWQLTAWWNDGSVMAHAGFPLGLGTTVEKVIAGLRDDRLVLEEDGRLIGEAHYQKTGSQTAEIGIKICEPDCQNRRLGRIILSMLIRYLFDYGFEKIVLDTNLQNVRAQHVYESLGFQKLRINTDSWTDQLGQKQSSVDYELTPENFVDYRKQA